MYYSHKQKERAGVLLSDLNYNCTAAKSLAVVFFLCNLSLILYAFVYRETVEPCGFIVQLIVAIISIFLIIQTFQYSNRNDYIKAVLANIEKNGSRVRNYDVDVCPCCDSPTQMHTGSYTTGTDNRWMGDVANYGGKYGAKKAAGYLGQFAGAVLGGFFGVPEWGSALGELAAKSVAGEVYDESIKSAVSSNFKDNRQVHTYSYYTCPKGCALPKNEDDLANVISANYSVQDVLFRFCRQTLFVLAIPYLVLLILVLLTAVIGIVAFVFYLMFSDISIRWMADWHWYVGGSWTWFIDFLSSTWYSLVPTLIFLFMLSCLADDCRKIKTETKFLEFGIKNEHKAEGKRFALWVVLLSLGSLIMPIIHMLSGGYSDGDNGYEYVDLGLSVRWATKNLGASDDESVGDYLSWGEIKPKDSYTDRNYMYGGVTKHMVDFDLKAINPRHDAAHRIMGGKWRMPTRTEFKELFDNCSWTTQTKGGGKLFIGKSKINGNTIVIPSSGLKYVITHVFSSDEDFSEYTSAGCYWTKDTEIGLLSADGGYVIIEGQGGASVRTASTDGFKGMTVRPVLDSRRK